MEIIGIISEYNPFHAGHLYHLRETKRRFPDSVLVALMSGYFVQRGEPAILSKWDRAKVAVMNGVDLVIELPTLFATSAAPDFARGAMTLLKKIGATHFSFGSEIEDLETLKNLSAYTESEVFRTQLRNYLDLGYSYSAASIRAGAPMLPNTILAAEYLKYAEGLKPVLIPRNSNHSDSNLYPMNPEMKQEKIPNSCGGEKTRISDASNGTSEEAPAMKIPFFSSAKAIRHAIRDLHNYDMSLSILQKLTGIDYTCIGESASSPASTPASSPAWNSLSSQILDALLLYRIRSTSAEEMKRIRGMSEGFENRLKKAALTATTTDQLISLAETRRFPRARIRRILMSILLQIPDFQMPASHQVCTKFQTSSVNTEDLKHPGILGSIDYIRILAFHEKGRRLLSLLKERPPSEFNPQDGRSLEIITKLSKSQNQSPLLELDKRASSIYATLTGAKDSEYRILPYIH